MVLLSRRAFLNCLLDGSLSVAALPPAFQVLLEAQRREVLFYEKLGGDEVQCKMCPNGCLLGDGDTGLCRARTNRGGLHTADAYANPCILTVDPVEKLPLNNFQPGTDTVCIAVGGCNLRCQYCQNYEWSQKPPRAIPRSFDLPPGKAVHAVLKKDVRTIAFTYTDPIGFFEYASDIADIAHRTGVKCIAASNCFAQKPLARKMAEKFDAITAGLKGFDEKFYLDVCGAALHPVLDAIVEIQASGTCWLEITTLIVPTYNDDMKKIKAMARWIRKNVGTKVPWHLSRFVPRYKLKDVPRTPVETLDEAMEIGLDEGLEYVYTSNIAPHKGNNTVCPRCRKTLIERVGFKVLKNDIQQGRCSCGHKLSGVFDEDRGS